MDPEYQRRWIMTVEHSGAKQYRARRHFPQESNECDIVVLIIYVYLCTTVSCLKGWKICYSKRDVNIKIS
jgi:hypothetical protein